MPKASPPACLIHLITSSLGTEDWAQNTIYAVSRCCFWLGVHGHFPWNFREIINSAASVTATAPRRGYIHTVQRGNFSSPGNYG